jgi:hypothetical protein
MSNLPTVSLAIDAARIGGARCLLRAPSAADLLADRLTLAAGDIYNVVLQFRDFSSVEAGADWQWPGGFTMDAALTDESTLTAAEPTEAAAVTSFAESGTGTHYYTGTLDLSGDNVDATIGEKASINCVFDIHVVVSGMRYTFRILATLYRAADGTYLTPGSTGEVVNSPNGQMRQRADGRFEMYDLERAAWTEFSLENGVIKFH